MFPFSKILDYIADEKCALVVGPEIMRFGDKPMNLHLRDALYTEHEDLITHYYQNDGLFLFDANDNTVKSDVAQALKLKSQALPQAPGFDAALLRKIIALPFHLIVSINPDTFLSDTCYHHGIRHRFAWFRSREKAALHVAEPRREEPLIYNLCGSVMEDESLVLDYEDLFSLISGSLGAPGLPDELQKSLEKVRTYVFLGFSFEKWYTQLLLRILCGEKKFVKYAGPHRVDGPVHDFLVHQFKVEFWDEAQGDFLDTLYAAAENYQFKDPQRAGQPFLRALLANPLTAGEESIVRHIQNGQLSEALAALTRFTQGTPRENEAVVLSGRFANLQRGQATMDSRDYIPEQNRIIDAIVALAREAAGATKVSAQP